MCKDTRIEPAKGKILYPGGLDHFLKRQHTVVIVALFHFFFLEALVDLNWATADLSYNRSQMHLV